MMFRTGLLAAALVATGCTVAPDQAANDAVDASATNTSEMVATEATPAPAPVGNIAGPQSTSPVVNHAEYDAVPPAAPLPAGPAPAGSCAAEIGVEAATTLATECRAVSPATRPPCNPANSCDMIRAEIERGCAMLGEDDRPRACRRAGEGS